MGMMGNWVELMETDGIGRITKLLLLDGSINTGHSVCGNCGKDMPICWDTVCHNCHKTFCYECSIAIDGFWYCVDCRGNINGAINPGG